MSVTNRLFTYSSTPINGAGQYGNLAISNSYIPGYTWWGGPDENIGYVIAHTDTSVGNRTERNHAAVIPVNSVGFWRTPSLSEDEFVIMFNSLFNQSYLTASSVATWLNNNGYWTSYTTRWAWYRWQITDSKVYPPVASCVQASEFSFMLNGVDVSLAGCIVTNPNGSNPVGETPPNLVDGNLSTKALDLNFVTNGKVTNFIFQFPVAKEFNGYRWATANDEESRDPKSWTISGSSDGVNWTVLHTVVGFTSTSSRGTWNTPLYY